jgi:hypothetical protein
MTNQITDIIETLVNQLTFTGTINNLIDNVDGTFTIEVCETFHVQPICSMIDIGGTDYKVTQVVNNTSITFTASVAPVGTTFSIEGPKYFHGTRIAINNELTQITQGSNKMPMVFVWEVIREIFNLDDENRIERTSDLRIFFLGQRPPGVDKTDTLYADAVVPMWNLSHEFVKLLKNNVQIGELDGNFTLINFAKFGVEGVNGATDSFFNEELGGTELRIDLPILKKFTCKGACDVN